MFRPVTALSVATLQSQPQSQPPIGGTAGTSMAPAGLVSSPQVSADLIGLSVEQQREVAKFVAEGVAAARAQRNASVFPGALEAAKQAALHAALAAEDLADSLPESWKVRGQCHRS